MSAFIDEMKVIGQSAGPVKEILWISHVEGVSNLLGEDLDGRRKNPQSTRGHEIAKLM